MSSSVLIQLEEIRPRLPRLFGITVGTDFSLLKDVVDALQETLIEHLLLLLALLVHPVLLLFDHHLLFADGFLLFFQFFDPSNMGCDLNCLLSIEASWVHVWMVYQLNLLLALIEFSLRNSLGVDRLLSESRADRLEVDVGDVLEVGLQVSEERVFANGLRFIFLLLVFDELFQFGDLKLGLFDLERQLKIIPIDLIELILLFLVPLF